MFVVPIPVNWYEIRSGHGPGLVIRIHVFHEFNGFQDFNVSLNSVGLLISILPLHQIMTSEEGDAKIASFWAQFLREWQSPLYLFSIPFLSRPLLVKHFQPPAKPQPLSNKIFFWNPFLKTMFFTTLPCPLSVKEKQLFLNIFFTHSC